MPIAPSETTTREAKASRRASARWAAVAGAAEEVGDEAMDEAPWDATAVGFALPVESARGQTNRAGAGVDIGFHKVDCILCAGTPRPAGRARHCLM
ncbi:hypothetical protein GCM10019017_64220 [Streptomyces showdoensis]